MGVVDAPNTDSNGREEEERCLFTIALVLEMVELKRRREVDDDAIR